MNYDLCEICYLADLYHFEMLDLGVEDLIIDREEFCEQFMKSFLRSMEDPNACSYVCCTIPDPNDKNPMSQIIGIIIGKTMMLEDYQSPSGVGYIELLYIHPHHREEHIGTQLVAAIEKKFREAGHTKSCAMVWQGNIPPQQGLMRLGYHYENVLLSKDITNGKIKAEVGEQTGNLQEPHDAGADQVSDECAAIFARRGDDGLSRIWADTGGAAEAKTDSTG